MKTESIPPALRNLLTKLEYISMIERGQKPCFSDMTFVQSNSWFGAWKRLIAGENKKNLLFEVEQIIDRTILAIEEYSNKEYIKLLLENLAKAKIGIENLILTYTEHPETISNLRVYIINIDLTLKKHGVSINPYEIGNQQTWNNSGISRTQRSAKQGSMFSPNDNDSTQRWSQNVASSTHSAPKDTQNGHSNVEIQNAELQKMIDTLNISRSQTKSSPLAIIPPVTNDPKQKLKSESFKRFTPKDYIEKHMFSPSSPDQALGSLSSNSPKDQNSYDRQDIKHVPFSQTIDDNDHLSDDSSNIIGKMDTKYIDRKILGSESLTKRNI
jgi:hypothetical protein